LGHTLTRNDQELVLRFNQLKKFSDIADLLEVTSSQLAYYTHGGQMYSTFSIPKKGGGARTISAPANALNILQKKLNYIFQLVYRPTNVVHGFRVGKGVVSNASLHSRARYVLNVDLKEFFPTITFPRIRGMLMAKPYELSPNVATIISRICSYQGSLPQGAPTSPVLANMLCARMDSQLKSLAKEHKCFYTRYADDLTFSTYLPRFPRALASYEAIGDSVAFTVGPALAAVIDGNGFFINPKKVRLQPHSSRQEVTGLTVNQTPNVGRRYVRQIRAMFHAWRKYGLHNAGTEYFSKYDRKSRFKAGPESFRYVVKGKIDFLGMVKGKQSRVYLSLLKQFAQLNPTYSLPPELPTWETNLSELKKAVWALRGNSSEGTAFYLKDVGLITCAHVIDGNENLVAFHPDSIGVELPVKVDMISKDYDLAVLSFVTKPQSCRVLIAGESQVYIQEQVTLLGYPNFHPGATGIIYKGAVIGQFIRFGQQRIQVSCEIAQGNSGGPVLNDDYMVIGIAANGKERLGKRAEELYGVIPIGVLLALVRDQDSAH
jgi:RNA-directed DNA polymerase